MTPACTPRGTTRRMSTSLSASMIPSLRRTTTSVPPWMKRPPSSSSRLDGCRSSTLLLVLRGLEGAQHLLTGDGKLVHVGAGRIADRVADRGGDRDDRRLTEPFRAEVGQVLVRLVHE